MATLVFRDTSVRLDTWFQKGLYTPESQADEEIINLHGSKAATQQDQPSLRLERRLGDTELSYYLPSRGDGVNDMYLHLGYRAHPSVMERSRVRLIWAIMRVIHPLLASRIHMHEYDDIRFVYDIPQSLTAALFFADSTLEYCSQSSHDLVDTYLNGSRTLSDERLSYLIVNSNNSNGHKFIDSPKMLQYDLLICATHFLGDGMALHQFANDLFTLLGSHKTPHDLLEMLDNEIASRRTNMKHLPKCLEDRLPVDSDGRLRRLAVRVDHLRSQEKLVGGQAFPRRTGNSRKTVVHNEAFDCERSKLILKACKSRGVSVSSALFAVCNVAWARTSNKSPQLPLMMYSALNMRPHLISEEPLHDSYWFLAIGFFNVVLPSFMPACGDSSSLFWHRSREAKKQSAAAMKSPMLIPRARELARERSARAKIWARQDDGKPVEKETRTPLSLFGKTSERPPSTALMGLSLLGNLDSIYKHSTYPDIQLHTLTTGSRQRAGGLLMFGYTFAGKLWVSLGYDENGFDKDVIETFWKNVLQVVDNYMLS
ncbi:hypothetical protein AX17_000823 [Amanita inopinata Kibby_2008]|nr:hypothetical protein AX17_000823 [Amanita inopinata Kibby_2008]